MSDVVRIILFEDNPEHQEIFLTYLSMTGYANAEVTTTPSMQKGKTLLESAEFDIIFLDLALDDSTVGESMQSIKSLNQYGPVVVLTSLDDRETIMNIINKGAQDCLPKSELSDSVLERIIHFNLDRWRLRNQLILSEQKVRNYSQALEQSGEAIVITDADGHIMHINHAFTEITGYSEEEVVGKNPKILNSGQQDKQFYDVMWGNLKQGIVWHDKVIDKKKSGEFYPAMLTISPIKDEGGNITNYIGVQQNLEQYELLEERFHQAEKMKGIGILAAGMSHEINNPLGGMLQALQNIERRFSSQLEKNRLEAEVCGIDLESLQHYMQRRQIPKFIEDIRTSGSQVAEIVNSMRKFSQPSVGKKEKIDLAEILKKTSALALFDSEINDRYGFNQIKLLTEFEHGLPSVFCSPEDIQQVLLNLFKNSAQAFHFQKKKTDQPQIKVCATVAGEMVKLIVEDNGPGMSDKVKRNAFEPFFTTRDPDVGKGLGLSVAYSLVHDINHGEIEIESSEGEGTRCIILLPLEQQS